MASGALLVGHLRSGPCIFLVSPTRNMFVCTVGQRGLAAISSPSPNSATAPTLASDAPTVGVSVSEGAVRTAASQTLPVKVTSFESKTRTPKSRRTGLIGVKLGMTHTWDEWGGRIPLTAIQVRGNSRSGAPRYSNSPR